MRKLKKYKFIRFNLNNKKNINIKKGEAEILVKMNNNTFYMIRNRKVHRKQILIINKNEDMEEDCIYKREKLLFDRYERKQQDERLNIERKLNYYV